MAEILITSAKTEVVNYAGEYNFPGRDNMDILDKSRFHSFTLDGIHLIIGFRGGLYQIDDRTSRFLEGQGDTDDGTVAEELMSIDRMEGNEEYRPPSSQRSLRALCLNVTSGCNLSCVYCFARPDGQSAGSTHMKYDTASKALEFLFSRSSPEAVLQVDFFGGEPLLNFEVMKRTVGKAREMAAERKQNIKFTATTNGTLFNNEITEFLNREDFSVIISLDGPPELHDRNRPFHDGSPSQERALSCTKRFLESRDYRNYYIRGTFTPENLSLALIARYYISQGFHNFSLEPARGKKGAAWAVTEEHLPALEREYEELARCVLSYREEGTTCNFFHFNIFSDSPLCVTRRLTGCGAGVEYLSVTPEGDIFPCHQLHAFGEFRMGNVNDEAPPFFQKIRDTFLDTHIYRKKGCSLCWARYYCSGGCHAHALLDSGDILTPDPIGCRLQKKRLECALWIESRKKKEKASFFESAVAL